MKTQTANMPESQLAHSRKPKLLELPPQTSTRAESRRSQSHDSAQSMRPTKIAVASDSDRGKSNKPRSLMEAPQNTSRHERRRSTSHAPMMLQAKPTEGFNPGRRRSMNNKPLILMAAPTEDFAPVDYLSIRSIPTMPRAKPSKSVSFASSPVVIPDHASMGAHCKAHHDSRHARFDDPEFCQKCYDLCQEAYGSPSHQRHLRIKELERTHEEIADLCEIFDPRTLNLKDLQRQWGMPIKEIILKIARTAAQTSGIASASGIDIPTQFSLLSEMSDGGLSANEALQYVVREKEKARKKPHSKY